MYGKARQKQREKRMKNAQDESSQLLPTLETKVTTAITNAVSGNLPTSLVNELKDIVNRARIASREREIADNVGKGTVMR